MNVADIAVVIAAAVAMAGLGWFFFAPRRARTAQLEGGVQRVEVTVRGGYSPDVIRVRQGVPVEMVFDRQESGDCTSRVVFADLAVSAALPAFERTTVRLRPGEAGSFGFACGMNMIHGTLVVDPAGDPAAAPAGRRSCRCRRTCPPSRTPVPSRQRQDAEARGGRAAGGDRRPDPPGASSARC